MSVYKQFNTQDIIVSPLEVNKSFTFKGEKELSVDNNIGRYTGRPGKYINDPFLTGAFVDQESAVLVFEGVKHLYYSNYLQGSDGEISNASTASYYTDGRIYGARDTTNNENYEETTLNPQKNWPEYSGQVGVWSIPTRLFGNYIQPKSFIITSQISGSITDDGEGRLLYRGTYCGNIIYQHGMVILTSDPVYSFEGPLEPTGYGDVDYGDTVYGLTTITSSNFIPTFMDDPNITCSFSSSYTIYETQYKCEVESKEYNYTLNPTTLSGSKGDVYNYVTSSFFDPYITTVGLYNENYELLAVGKLSKPLPKNEHIDTNILINIDR